MTIWGEATQESVEVLVTLWLLIVAMGVMMGWYGRG